MSQVDVIRAWKDADFRAGLSEAEKAQLPANPAGLVELSDADLTGAVGADGVQPDTTLTTPSITFMTVTFVGSCLSICLNNGC